MLPQERGTNLQRDVENAFDAGFRQHEEQLSMVIAYSPSHRMLRMVKKPISNGGREVNGFCTAKSSRSLNGPSFQCSLAVK